MVKSKLSAIFDELFTLTRINFLSITSLSGSKVLRGDKILNSCYYLFVTDSDGEKILIVKLYDKVMDVISIENSFIVGSQINVILGAKRYLN